jgi:putative addiction module CopG family antidote
MTIHLDEQWADLVRRKMETDGYETAEAVVEAAMRLLRDRETGELDRLRQGIAAGMADIEAGRMVDGETAFARLRERAAAYRKALR